MRIGLIILLIPMFSFASVELPTNLDQADRRTTLKILGNGTSQKVLSEPYPLGGYSGFEIGVEVESVPTETISQLGSTTGEQKNLIYPKFTVGKGLYDDFDVYFTFVPYNEQTGISQYGGKVKWSFYQATFVPASFSVLFHANHSNIQNKLHMNSGGVSAITGITMNFVSVYFGGGKVYSSGEFKGGSSGITDTGSLEKENSDAFHFMVGTVIKIEPVFLAFELDQHSEPILSGKLGFRY